MSDKLFSEIESYLRTGRAAPAAPEPQHEHRRKFRLRSRRRRRVWSRPAVRVVVVIVIGVAGIYIVRHQMAHNQDGTDHASAAPAGLGYIFEHTNPSGTPVRWNPCSPIKYRTNFSAAPPYVASEFQTALEKLETATGLRFVNVGTSTFFEFGVGRSPGPVLVVWATPEQTSQLKALSLPIPGTTEEGRAFVEEERDPLTGFGQFVTGEVVFDATAAQLPPGFGPGSLGVLFLHELGHLVGLGHVSDASQIMNPVLSKTKSGDYGSGDLAGLVRLGRASGCLNPPLKARLIPVV